jgi:uncharacterized Fe-S radical SAM superfamily protein PflX
VNLMEQYRPAHRVLADAEFSEINRAVGQAEFQRAVAEASQAGLWRLDK